MAKFIVTGHGQTASQVAGKLIDESNVVGVLYTNDGQEINDYSAAQDYIKNNSKEYLLSLKNSGYKSTIRDTTGRYGPAKEYYGFVVTFDKAESQALQEKFSDSELNELLPAIVADKLKNHAQGQRHVYITNVHTETGNVHVQGFVHDFAIDHEKRTISTNLKTSSDSSIAKLSEKIRKGLSEKGIDVNMTPFRESQDLHADKATPWLTKEVKDEAAAALEAAGGQRTAEYNHGPADHGPADPMPADGRGEYIETTFEVDEALLKKGAQDAEREQQQATAKAILMQNAVAAVTQRDKALHELYSTKNELDGTKNELAGTQEKLTATETDLASMQEKNLDLEAELSGTKESLAEKIQEHDSLAEEFNTLYEDAQGLEKQLKATETDLNSTKTELNNTRAELAGTQTELDSTRTELDSTKTELAGTRTELDSTKTDLSDTRIELDNTKARLAELERALIAEQQQRQQAETQLESVKMQITAERETFSTVKSELKETISDLKTEKSDLKTEIAALTAENDSLKESLKSAKALNETYEAENEGLKQQLESGKGQDLEQE